MNLGGPFAALPLLVFLGSITGLIWGITTSGRSFPDAHLDREFGLATATPARRLGGNLLDALILVVTLLIGWVIWFIIVAPRGQTPGKALVSTYVMRADGTRASGWLMVGREVLVKWLLFGIADFFLARLPSTIASLWCLWDDDKQCGWDKLVSTYVAYAPYGVERLAEDTTVSAAGTDARLLELQQLRAEGLITAEEYEERRQRLIDLV
jgi:uncharacterized RDD family membrane protein YckC